MLAWSRDMFRSMRRWVNRKSAIFLLAPRPTTSGARTGTPSHELKLTYHEVGLR